MQSMQPQWWGGKTKSEQRRQTAQQKMGRQRQRPSGATISQGMLGASQNQEEERNQQSPKTSKRNMPPNTT